MGQTDRQASANAASTLSMECNWLKDSRNVCPPAVSLLRSHAIQICCFLDSRKFRGKKTAVSQLFDGR